MCVPADAIANMAQGELGKGSFQELDQVKAVQQFTKYAGRASSIKDIVSIVETAVEVRYLCMCSLRRPPIAP